jgi:hypothetical protein
MKPHLIPQRLDWTNIFRALLGSLEILPKQYRLKLYQVAVVCCAFEIEQSEEYKLGKVQSIVE